MCIVHYKAVYLDLCQNVNNICCGNKFDIVKIDFDYFKSLICYLNQLTNFSTTRRDKEVVPDFSGALCVYGAGRFVVL